MKAKQADRGGDGQLEEIGGADQRRRAGNAVVFPNSTIECVGEPRIEKHLNQDRHREQRDHAGLLQNLLPLESEQQHQRREQRSDRPGTDTGHRGRESGSATLAEKATPNLRQGDRDHDVEEHRGQQRAPGHGDGGHAQE
jgi:hypothetical protein